ILPSARDVAFWLALLGAIGVIADTAVSAPVTCTLQSGDHVYVDGKAIRTFRGFTEINGTRYLRLERQFKQKGIPLRRIDNWPATPDNLARLQPAGDGRKPAGEIKYEQGSAELSPLDRLLHPSEP